VPDLATLQAVIANRYAIATTYARSVKEACAAELASLRERGVQLAHVPSMRRVKRWLSADNTGDLPEHERATLAQVLEHSKALQTIYAMRQELNTLWERSTESTEQLVHRLQDWLPPR
jgi:stearoyl-CoA desaturase (delta-9 desaturase)